MKGYKLIAADGSAPLQRGEPFWDTVTFPFELPKTKLDISDADCGEGWNFCRDIATAARIAGLWRNGEPRHVVVVESLGRVVERGDKCRAEGLRILKPASTRTMESHLGKPFGEHAARMGRSQVAWWQALARPEHDEAKVEAGVSAALEARGLNWSPKRFRDVRDVWEAREAWDARAAWDVQAAWEAREAWDAWGAWDVRVARDAWEAWDAWDALSAEYAGLMGWTKYSPDLFTIGIRDAYRSGLALIIPTGPSELGWVMS